jgi:sulfide:quinone oxidoreductase
VLIAGGGVAGLEAALALRELAGDRVDTTLLAPTREFVYLPMRVLEPFGYGSAPTYSLEEIARDVGAELITDTFKRLDGSRSVVHTNGGVELEYDALLLAIGAHLDPAFSDCLTIDVRHLGEQLHGLVEDVEGGRVRSIAFIASSPMPWPLSAYELALLTARRAHELGIELSITIATPEHAPLAIFGPLASAAVMKLLKLRGINAILSHHVDVTEPGIVSIQPGHGTLHVDRVVALPRLTGPSTPGVPDSIYAGFIPIDSHCRVPTLACVWAAGDATEFLIKHGGIAAHQADTAAAGIAALAGVSVEVTPFRREIDAVLLGGDSPLYLSARMTVTGEYGSDSEVADTPTPSHGAKIAAKYLAPYLESRDRAAAR